MYALKYAIKLRPLYEATEGVALPRINFPAATPISHNMLNYIAVAVDVQENWIYYSDVRKDVIYRAHPDGSGILECSITVYSISECSILNVQDHNIPYHEIQYLSMQYIKCTISQCTLSQYGVSQFIAS